MLQACGEPHKPLFTVLCQLASIKRTGIALTKKVAKQIAARRVLKIVQSALQQNENEQQIATLDSESEPTEKVPQTYLQWKRSGTKHLAIRLNERHNWLETQLSQEDRNAVYDILCGKDAVRYKDSELVDRVCDQLNLKYDVCPIAQHPQKFSTFVLRGNYDVVLVNETDKLYSRAVDYFKTMMNFQKIESSPLKS